MNTATSTPAKKITMATVKSFINKNRAALHINVKSSFDGMTDCCESRKDGWKPAAHTDRWPEHTKGVEGAWFVNNSRDYITPYNEAGMTGFEIYNCCGTFILAVKK